MRTKAGNITQGDLYKQMKDTIGQDQFNTLVRSVTEEKVLSKKYKVTDKELDQQLNILREQYGDQVDSVIKQKGEKEVKDMLKVDILREKAATAGIKVSDKELKKAYDEYKAQKPQIRASHILVKDEKTANEVEAKINVAGETEVWETSYSGVWWIRHKGAGDQVLSDQIVVTTIPEILKTHPSDAMASFERLRNIIDSDRLKEEEGES